jgi:hypothetical protein
MIMEKIKTADRAGEGGARIRLAFAAWGYKLLHSGFEI